MKANEAKQRKANAAKEMVRLNIAGIHNEWKRICEDVYLALSSRYYHDRKHEARALQDLERVGIHVRIERLLLPVAESSHRKV